MKHGLPIAVLALLGGIVTGREQPAEPVPTPLGTRPAAEGSTALPQLELERLERAPSERSSADLFAPGPASRSVTPLPARSPSVAPEPPLPVAAAAPAPPTAPSLPFAYLGRMVKGERIVVYVMRGEEMLVAEAGQMLGQDYRVEGVTDSGLHFLYVPLGTRQVHNFPMRESP